MNILFVAPAPPFPAHDGARLVVANLARVLAAQHTLALVSFADDEMDYAALQNYFAHVELVPHRPPPRWRKWATSFLDATPLWVRAHAAEEMRAALRARLRSSAFDVAHVDTGLMAQYADALEKVPRVLAPHDSLTRAAEQQLHHAPRARERFAARSQVAKLEQYEAAAYQNFARVIVVTASERAYLQTLAPALNVCVIPNGVDTEFFAPQETASIPDSIGFLGVMNYAPNRAAALFFVREVLPHIWRTIPNATFTLIGKNPPAELLALTRDARIRVTGEVADVRPHVAAQSIMVCPLRDAGGIKNKMLEAMALGRAIVATSDAADGLDARAGDEFLLADDAPSLANACVRLLRDAELRARLERAARAWARQHSWRAAAEQYLNVYRAAISEF